MPRTTKSTAAAKTTRTRRPRVGTAAVNIEKTQIEKFLAKVPDEFAFWSHDGRVLRDMKDLKDGLANMSDQDFAYHSNDVKKDFSKWVRDIIGDEKLAYDLEMASSRELAARIVEERYTFLSSQHAKDQELTIRPDALPPG